MEESIFSTGSIGPLLDAGLKHTREYSPCLRRRYCAQIVSEGPYGSIVGFNARISRACTETVCARDRFQAKHGQRAEICGEIHAEQSALVWYAPPDWLDAYAEYPNHFLLSGWDQQLNRELLGREVYPCHVCALMIKHAGFKYVILRGVDAIEHVSIDQIIEEREEEWEKA